MRRSLKTRLIVARVFFLTLVVQSMLQGSLAQSTDAPVSRLQSITVLFKFDPGPTYGGVRWISPSTFVSGLQSGKEAAIDIKVQGADVRGRSMMLTPEWIPADSEMIAVSAVSQGSPGQFRLIVKRPGESKVRISAQDVSKELLVKAQLATNGLGMQVQVSQ